MYPKQLLPLFLFTLLAASVLPEIAHGQGVTIRLHPRDVQPATSATDPAVAPADPAHDLLTDTLAPARAERGWIKLDELNAARVWGRPGSLLPSAIVSPGTGQTAVYTELAQTFSGGWRFVLGTALALESTEDTDDAGAAEARVETQTGFHRFITGGGNVSFAAMRPLAVMRGSNADQVLIAVPRVWANVPVLSGAQEVNDLGIEMASEYQFRLHARSITEGDTLAGRDEQPFLVLQLRGGVVGGTNAFYRTIGRDGGKPFAYAVPTLNLDFPNGVRLGASWFYGFGAFPASESIRFQVTLAPVARKEQPTGSPAGGS